MSTRQRKRSAPRRPEDVTPAQARRVGPTTEALIKQVKEKAEASRSMTPEQLRRALVTTSVAKKQRTTGTGKPLQYLACIFCGKSQYVFAPEHPPFSGDILPLEYKVYQQRHASGGPGRGNVVKGVGGFPVDPAASLTILEMIQEHPQFVENIKRRLLKIVHAYLEAGILKPEELEVG